MPPVLIMAISSANEPANVKLKFSQDIAETIADRIWHPSQKIHRHKDGSLTLSMKAVVSDELLGWVSSWQHYVEILGPRKMREEILKRSETIKMQYDEKIKIIVRRQ